MLVATLRSDNPLGAASLTCDGDGETLTLEGAGEITAAKLLDLENRRQLVWVSEAWRDRVLGKAIARIRREASDLAGERAEAAAAAAVVALHEVGSRVSGTPAAPTRFDVPTTTARESSRVVWAQSPDTGSALQQTPGEARSRARRSRTWAIASVACVAAAAVCFLFPHQVVHQLAISFTRRVTPYTELYFTNPETLPARLGVPGPNQFEFTVVNHEGRQRVYPYVVTLSGPRGTSVVERGTIPLRNDSGAGRVVDVFAPARHTVYVITVLITGSLQTIHFKGYS